MVQAHNLTKHFEDSKRGVVRAVDGVSFKADSGKITGLLGANGAGKSTVLRMLSTVVTPTSGSAEVAGHDVVSDARKVRSSIGFMSASTALYGRLTAREMIEYLGGLYGLSQNYLDERVEFVLDKLKIREFEHRLCDKLSTGQKQRVSIARTIVHDPPVLFFDEPTSGLDVIASQTVLGFIEECRTEGKTVIFSSHIMTEAERLCDHLILIHEGKIRGSGSLTEIKALAEETTLERAFLKLVGYEGETE